MFLSRTGLRKLMTQAYKGQGLKVRNDGAGLSITGTKWSVYFLMTDMPKEVLGDLISLVGQLPACMESYEASPEGNQMLLYDPDEQDAMEAGRKAGPKLEKLPLILMSGGPIAVLQNPDFGKHDITLVDDYRMGLINPKYVNKANDESYPEGPLQGGGMIEGRFLAAVTWYNNRMGFSLGFEDTIDEYGGDIAHILDGHLLWRSPKGRAAEVET